MRKRARKDGNQDDIVQQLRWRGVSVWITSQLGNGAPDLVLGWRGQNWLIELKDPAQDRSKRKLTPDEKTWHGLWRGQVDTVETLEQILDLLDLKSTL